MGKHEVSVVILTVGLLMSACATTTSLREHAPTKEFTSTRSAQDVASCINDSWKNAAPLPWMTVPVSMEIHPDKFTVAQITPAGLIVPETVRVMVDVLKDGTGSKTRYYEYLSTQIGDTLKLVEQCQQSSPSKPAP